MDPATQRLFNRIVQCIKQYIQYSQKLLPGEISPILPPALIGEILSTNFLSRVNDYIEDMATFTALVKKYSNTFLQYKEKLGLMKFCPAKIFNYTVSHFMC